MPNILDVCARELMDTAPQIVQMIRVEMRRGRGMELSIPQFRTLRYIQRNPDTSLSSLAEYLGLTLPSVSKLVDGMVKEELVVRQESNIDRRRLTLVLTPAGELIVNSARAMAQANIAKKLGALCDEDLETIRSSMVILHKYFMS